MFPTPREVIDNSQGKPVQVKRPEFTDADIRRGAVVTLRSGGPMMTVGYLTGKDGWKAMCYWHSTDGSSECQDIPVWCLKVEFAAPKQ